MSEQWLVHFVIRREVPPRLSSPYRGTSRRWLLDSEMKIVKLFGIRRIEKSNWYTHKSSRSLYGTCHKRTWLLSNEKNLMISFSNRVIELFIAQDWLRRRTGRMEHLITYAMLTTNLSNLSISKYSIVRPACNKQSTLYIWNNYVLRSLYWIQQAWA